MTDISALTASVKKKADINELDTLLFTGRTDDVFAACYACTEKHLGITPYDEQIEGAAHLVNGSIAEMQTGEGKTLSAVFAACYHAVNGHNVHILTFNDYLAKRDYHWMKPIYDAMGISCAYITQSSSTQERREAYKAQVLYITARECGFDFLRDFVANSPEDMVQNGFDAAIADEADSIMIDEARVPLVIAGETAVTPDADLPQIYERVKKFDPSLYDINTELDTIYLTEKGEDICEELFCDGGGLYDEEYNELLTKITDCLRACFLLKRDVDYIVKDGAIKIIDEFTGRAAENRRYPGTLQGAVELKEGIQSTVRGVIMGIVPLQFFLRQYPVLSGMTGTAKASEDEFHQLYDLKVNTVDTHSPCRRTDHPLEVYVTKKSKYAAILKYIKAAHEKRQPILIGTASIEESEMLGEMLTDIKIPSNILNAKNDELEAEIIKEAGKPGAVTISANMSGRGVDIKPGGANELLKEEALGAGGLLVIGTFISDTVRGDMQLKGRTGRQGDIGESRFFTSLEDDIMIKYNLKSLISKRHYPDRDDGKPITDKHVLREVSRIQRIAQGDTLELRKRLLKFTMIGEKHRNIVFGKRRAILTGEKAPRIWQDVYSDMYDMAVKKFGDYAVDELEKKTVLQIINEYWSDYLDYTSYLRDGIHLTRIGGKDPAEEYNIACEEFFSGMEGQIIDTMGEYLDVLVSLDHISDYKLDYPTSLSTYILNESGEELLKKSFIETALDENELL